jgi:phosphate transport system substrate-binding protein
MIRQVLLFLAFASTALAQQVTLTGAGSTFAYPLYSSWASQYNKIHPNVQVNYQSIGSGGGIRQVISGTVDFGGTDGPMNDQQLGDARGHRGTDILHFPVALGADVPTYNVRLPLPASSLAQSPSGMTPNSRKPTQVFASQATTSS